MKLKCLGSSSKGNSYLLIGEHRTLLLEAGVSLGAVKIELDFKISNIDGCIITHEHLDHAGKISEYLKAGIPCYSSPGTIEATGIASHNFHPLFEKRKYKIGEFGVMPFPVIHDAKQPYGYLIHHPESGLILFITDSKYSPYRFYGLNQVMIEANFSQDIIDDATLSGGLHPAQRARIMNSHMSLENCIDLLKANDLKAVNNIVLLHGSDGNSNSREFKQTIENVIGKRVTVADRDMEINFNKGGF